MDNYLSICVCILLFLSNNIQASEDNTDEASERICENEKIPNTFSNGIILYQMEKPVDPFIGRKSELNELMISQSNDKAVVITGAKGIGKSELARKYAMIFREEDTSSNIIWIDAESHDSLSFSFKDLASYIGVDIKDKTSSEIIVETFVYFANRRALFIFDNAESSNYVLNNLSKFMILRSKDIHFIITSRDKQWNRNKFQILDLSVFTENEATEFISKNINTDNENIDDIKNLAKLLRYIPLALSKAAKYIHDQNENKVFTINDFIREYLDIDSKKSPNVGSVVEHVNEKVEEIFVEHVPQTESSQDVYSELGLRPTVTQYITSVRPPTRHETKEFIIDKIEHEASRARQRISHAAKQAERNIGRFFKRLRNDVSG